LARLGLDLTVCQGELARVRREIESVQQRAAQAKLQHEAAAKSRTEAEAESARLTAEVAQLRGAVQAEQDELSAAKADSQQCTSGWVWPKPWPSAWKKSAWTRAPRIGAPPAGRVDQ